MGETNYYKITCFLSFTTCCICYICFSYCYFVVVVIIIIIIIIIIILSFIVISYDMSYPWSIINDGYIIVGNLPLTDKQET